MRPEKVRRLCGWMGDAQGVCFDLARVVVLAEWPSGAPEDFGACDRHRSSVVEAMTRLGFVVVDVQELDEASV